MNLSQIPIHQRLDALLERLDDHEWDDEAGYNDFVERRAKGARGEANPSSLFEDAGAEAEELLQDETELAGLRTRTSASRLVDDDDSETFASEPETQQDADGEAAGGDSESEGLHGAGSSPPHGSVLSQGDHAAGSRANDIVERVYNEAGLAPRGATHSNPDLNMLHRRHRRTMKQGQAQLEEAARQHQELERSLADDIGAHTTKQRSVATFLADLDSDESFNEAGAAELSGEDNGCSDVNLLDNTPADEQLAAPRAPVSEPMQRAGRHLELLSSPPRMPGLRSFISKRPTSPLGSESESDLEIIPETKTNRLSRPVKTLLKLSGGGGTATERRRAQEERRLRKLEMDQIAKRRQERTERLKEQGLDIVELNKKLEEKRAQNAMRGSALLEQERERAQTLRAREYEGDSDSEEEFSEPDVISRPKKLLSDSEDDADEPDRKEATAPEHFTLTKTLRDAHDSSDTDEEVEERGIGRTGTQLVPQLDQSALAQMMQTMIDTSDTDAARSTAADEGSDADLANGAGTLGAATPGTASREMSDTSSLDDLSIVGDENAVGLAVQPDLADLQSKNLSSSQHLAEVRNRYLQAQQEQRRQDVRRARDQSAETPKFRSMFVEDQAEESDDDENGLGHVRRRLGLDENEDDDDANEADDADLQDLVDHGRISVKEAELRRKYLEEQKTEDQRLLNKMVDGVHGGFRRRRNGQGQFIDDDDSSLSIEADQQILEYLREVEERRKRKLLSNNAKVEKLARHNRAAAFFTSISEDLVSRPVNHRKSSVQESLQFLRSVAEKETKTFEAPAPREPPSESGGDVPQVALPKFDMAVRRRSTIQIADRTTRKNSTYTSRVSASELGSAKTVEILQSLGRPSETRTRPTKRFVAPKQPNSKRTRRALSVATETSAKRDDVLFRRHWS